jgi:glutathione peroxidase
LSGGVQSLGDYAGKVLLIVNTASNCGFTPQYEGLEDALPALSPTRPRGARLSVQPVRFAQEPGEADEIASFCQKNYGVAFPMFAKIDVNGEHAHPLYQYSEESRSRPARQRGRSSGTSPSSWSIARARWLERYASATDAGEHRQADIEALL